MLRIPEELPVRLISGWVWSIPVIVSAAVFALAIAFQLAQSPDGSTSSVVTPGFAAVTGPGEGRPRFKVGTRKPLGRFRVGHGMNASRLVGLSSVTTEDGSECLVEDDVDGESSSCLDGGFFALRKAEILVSTAGGPDRFDELYVAGVVAPVVRAARVVKADGSEVATELSSEGAFLNESTPADLEAKVYPTAVRLFGPSGRLVGTVTFPPAG
jgi:hypothetical protein